MSKQQTFRGRCETRRETPVLQQHSVGALFRCREDRALDPTNALSQDVCGALSMEGLPDGKDHARFAGGFVPNSFYLGERHDLGRYL